MADSKIPEKEDQASIEVNEKKRKELEAKLEKVGIKAPGYVHVDYIYANVWLLLKNNK